MTTISKFQAAAFVLVILLSVALTSHHVAAPPAAPANTGTAPAAHPSAPSAAPANVSFERASAIENISPAVRHVPVRKWDVPDPVLSARAALVYSLDDELTFFGANVGEARPAASLIKLLAAIAVLENSGENKKVAISEAAVAADGDAGDLQSGEVYVARDLLKIMLLTSSNDAAAAFAENGGGEREFVRAMQEKAEKIGMSATSIGDPAGLSVDTVSSPNDLLQLMRYILANHPEVLAWSRTPSFLVEPLNNPVSRTVQNINPLVADERFLGGKTGTLAGDAAQNLAALFSLQNRRVALVLMGSADRVRDTNTLLGWVEKAYEF